MTPILAFDIETIPDVAGIRRLYDLPAELPDAEVAEVAFQKRNVAASGTPSPPTERIVLPSHAKRSG